MEKKKIELMAVGALVIIFLFALSGLIKWNKPRAVQPSSTDIPNPAEFTMPPNAETLPAHTTRSEAASWGRDPFVLEETTLGHPSAIMSLSLKGIVAVSGSEPKAIVNDEILVVGSSIGDFKILSIAEDKVIVNDGNQDFELSIRRD